MLTMKTSPIQSPLTHGTGTYQSATKTISEKPSDYPLNTGQSPCLDVAVGWANGSIVTQH